MYKNILKLQVNRPNHTLHCKKTTWHFKIKYKCCQARSNHFSPGDPSGAFQIALPRFTSRSLTVEWFRKRRNQLDGEMHQDCAQNRCRTTNQIVARSLAIVLRPPYHVITRTRSAVWERGSIDEVSSTYAIVNVIDSDSNFLFQLMTFVMFKKGICVFFLYWADRLIP